jgi:hypothetical protein
MGIFNKLTQSRSSADSCCGGVCEKENKANNDDAIREIAYFRWLTVTGGLPVSEEETQRFWLEAEEEISKSN